MKHIALLAVLVASFTSSTASAYIVIGEAGRDGQVVEQIRLLVSHLLERVALLVS